MCWALFSARPPIVRAGLPVRSLRYLPFEAWTDETTPGELGWSFHPDVAVQLDTRMASGQ